MCSYIYNVILLKINFSNYTRKTNNNIVFKKMKAITFVIAFMVYEIIILDNI